MRDTCLWVYLFFFLRFKVKAKVKNDVCFDDKLNNNNDDDNHLFKRDAKYQYLPL